MANPGPSRISVLPPDVAARIAAGEVIERPAAVVKELIENSLDSGASRIDVSIEGGGLELIRVADDGQGIPADQVELAFARHGTSKLRDDADLEGVSTLGFRGEALPSIAAVADVSLLSRSAENVTATAVRLSYGQIVDCRTAARQRGTTVTVEELFAELPARRKFLRTRTSEGAQSIQAVSHLALARPEVAFHVQAEGRRVFATPGDADLCSAALAVRGVGFVSGAHRLGPLEFKTDGGVLLGRASGLLGSDRQQRANRSGLSLFLNGRWIQNRALSHAVEEGYQTVLRTGRHPTAIVFLEVPSGDVDVNVHPTKREVRLLHERTLYARLREAVAATVSASQHLWGDDGRDDEAQTSLAIDGPDLRVLGQVGATYIVAEGSLGLYLVDQHAAHERVLLEQLRAGVKGSLEQQQLLEPELLELPPELSQTVEEVCAALSDLGFGSEVFGGGSVLIRAVPAILAERRAMAGLEEAVDALAEGSRSSDWQARLSIELACKTAVKAGDSLASDEQQSLLRRLGEARLSESCAHGRPTSLLLSHSQLAKQFGRT